MYSVLCILMHRAPFVMCLIEWSNDNLICTNNFESLNSFFLPFAETFTMEFRNWLNLWWMTQTQPISFKNFHQISIYFLNNNNAKKATFECLITRLWHGKFQLINNCRRSTKRLLCAEFVHFCFSIFHSFCWLIASKLSPLQILLNFIVCSLLW